MTTLPSFVELMATLGIDQAQEKTISSRSSRSSSPNLLNIPAASPVRSRSSPSLRDQASSRNKGARYSPYTPNFLVPRRGSISSTCSSSPELERRALSSSPQPPSPPPRRRPGRRFKNGLSVDVYDSLPANTPISSFVRRKSPNGSPISPTFASADSPAASPMPFSIPTLPALFPPHSASSSESFPLTPHFEIEAPLSRRSSPRYKVDPLPDTMMDVSIRRSRHTGIRISTPPNRHSSPHIVDAA